jgi:hypothetical protein
MGNGDLLDLRHYPVGSIVTSDRLSHYLPPLGPTDPHQPAVSFGGLMAQSTAPLLYTALMCSLAGQHAEDLLGGDD